PTIDATNSSGIPFCSVHTTLSLYKNGSKDVNASLEKFCFVSKNTMSYFSDNSSVCLAETLMSKSKCPFNNTPLCFIKLTFDIFLSINQHHSYPLLSNLQL